MKFIEVTICSSTREIYTKAIINADAIIRIDDKTTTRIWLNGYDSEIYVLESYAYLRYTLNCITK